MSSQSEPREVPPTAITLAGFLIPAEYWDNPDRVEVLVAPDGFVARLPKQEIPLLEYLSVPHLLDDFQHWLTDHDYDDDTVDGLIADQLAVVYTLDDDARALDAFTGLRIVGMCGPVLSADKYPEVVWVAHDPSTGGEVLITSLLADIMWSSLPDEDIPTAAARLAGKWSVPDNLRGRFFFEGLTSLLGQKLARLEWLVNPGPHPENTLS